MQCCIAVTCVGMTHKQVRCPSTSNSYIIPILQHFASFFESEISLSQKGTSHFNYWSTA